MASKVAKDTKLFDHLDFVVNNTYIRSQGTVEIFRLSENGFSGEIERSGTFACVNVRICARDLWVRMLRKQVSLRRLVQPWNPLEVNLQISLIMSMTTN